VHEAGIAVAHLAPTKFWDFSYALFDAQTSYYDEPTSKESPIETRKRLASLAQKAAGIEEKDFLDQVSVTKGNGGNKTTADLKLAIKCEPLALVHLYSTDVHRRPTKRHSASPSDAQLYRHLLSSQRHAFGLAGWPARSIHLLVLHA
jgi:hypothetical protein